MPKPIILEEFEAYSALRNRYIHQLRVNPETGEIELWYKGDDADDFEIDDMIATDYLSESQVNWRIPLFLGD